MDLISLPAMLLQKTPFANLQNVLLIGIVLDTLSLPIKDLIHSNRSEQWARTHGLHWS